MSLCAVTVLCVQSSWRSRSLLKGRVGETKRTIQSDGNAFSQHVAIRADENGHLAQWVDFTQLRMVFAVLWVCVDDVQRKVLGFRDGENGGCSRIGLDGSCGLDVVIPSLELHLPLLTLWV